MRLRHLFVAAMLLMVGMMQAQQMPPIPVDKDVRIGKLDNGLTYYIRHNNYPEHTANFYIAQKVGSINENEDQRGLAHLLEHMAFNGSDHFKDNGLQEYLQSIGVEYGRNLNAYTATDQTVYYITDVSTERISALDSCMLVLKDWSNGLTLDAKAIDEERDVVHNEYRMRITGTQKILETVLPELYPGSKYGQRFPIGLMEVIDKCNPETLRAYYRKWYRPDNQGIIIVGDIDVDRTEAKIKELFGGITVPADAAKIELEAVPDNEQGIYLVGKDKEQTMSLILVAMKRDAVPDEAKGDMTYLIGNYLIDRLADVLNERYKEEAQKADCPFVEAEIENGNYLISRTKDAITLTIVPKEGKEKEALAAALREVKRAHDFGVNASEFDRAKTEYLSQVEKKYNNREKLPNNGYCQDYVEHFIGNEPIPSIEDLYQLMSQMSPMMPVEAVNEVAKQLLVEGEKNLVVLTLMQDKEGQTYPTRDELKAVTDKVWTEKLEAYVDNTRQEPIMATTPKAGKIVKEEQNSALGCTKLTLSNGATVLMKKTDFNDNEIVMSAYAKGGMSMFDKKDNSNMQMFGEVLSKSGLGNFSDSELTKALSGKQCDVDFKMDEIRHGMIGTTTPKDLETMMQLMYLGFTNVKKDEQSVGNFLNMMEVQLKNLSLNASIVFQDSIQSTMYDGNPLHRIPTVEDLKQVNYDRILEMARMAYGNAADFTFTFVGNYDEAQMRKYIEQYVASLPANKKAKAVKTTDVRTFSKGEVVRNFTKAMENPQAQAAEIWRSNTVDFSLKNLVLVDVAYRMYEMINNREIREKQSAAYYAGAQGQLDDDGQTAYAIITGVGMLNPDKAEAAIPYFAKNIQTLISTPDAEDLAKVKEIMLKQADVNARSNSHWRMILGRYARSGKDFQTDYKSTVQAVTLQDVSDFLKNTVLAGGNHIQVVMMPEKK